ncbi:hypothetical protein PROFUN_14693 [Planoprotostelium fungivorum]|uniref:C2 domain-containing protein n=1 Tax=Planoprotostelium fungivorum TaxID=1890364 RepID=A0A2P6MZ91_9EUKA|nr:hypothetical protein PROFUN_14693 [Planoprotostelium fungivorum]
MYIRAGLLSLILDAFQASETVYIERILGWMSKRVKELEELHRTLDEDLTRRLQGPAQELRRFQSERDFYFKKLRRIEQLLRDHPELECSRELLSILTSYQFPCTLVPTILHIQSTQASLNPPRTHVETMEPITDPLDNPEQLLQLRSSGVGVTSNGNFRTAFGGELGATFEREPNGCAKPSETQAYALANHYGLTLRFKQSLHVYIVEGRDISPRSRKSRDPTTYCKIKFHKQKMRTEVHRKTCNPKWDKFSSFQVSSMNLDKKLEIQVIQTSTMGSKKVIGVGYCSLQRLSASETNQLWVDLRMPEHYQHSTSKLRCTDKDTCLGEVKLNLTFSPPSVDNFVFHYTYQTDCVRLVDVSGTEYILDGRTSPFCHSWTLFRKADQPIPLVVVRRSVIMSLFEFFDPPTGDIKGPNRMTLVPQSIGKKLDVISGGTSIGYIWNNKMKTTDRSKKLIAQLDPSEGTLTISPSFANLPYIMAAMIVNHSLCGNLDTQITQKTQMRQKAFLKNMLSESTPELALSVCAKFVTHNFAQERVHQVLLATTIAIANIGRTTSKSANRLMIYLEASKLQTCSPNSQCPAPTRPAEPDRVTPSSPYDPTFPGP